MEKFVGSMLLTVRSERFKRDRRTREQASGGGSRTQRERGFCESGEREEYAERRSENARFLKGGRLAVWSSAVQS